jgi:hypothetical protein
VCLRLARCARASGSYFTTTLMTRKTILAVGAAGQFAGLAVTALSQRGARVRGLVRNEQQGNEAQRLGAAEVVIGDLGDLRSVDAALAGVDAVFFIAPAFLPDEAEVGTRFVDAVERSGARRIASSESRSRSHRRDDRRAARARPDRRATRAHHRARTDQLRRYQVVPCPRPAHGLGAACLPLSSLRTKHVVRT